MKAKSMTKSITAHDRAAAKAKWNEWKDGVRKKYHIASSGFSYRDTKNGVRLNGYVYVDASTLSHRKKGRVSKDLHQELARADTTNEKGKTKGKAKAVREPERKQKKPAVAAKAMAKAKAGSYVCAICGRGYKGSQHKSGYGFSYVVYDEATGTWAKQSPFKPKLTENEMAKIKLIGGNGKIVVCSHRIRCRELQERTAKDTA